MMATYDGFGNRLQQTVTKGAAPSHSVAVNGLNNQMIGQSYDLNGNLGQASQYDIENRPNNYWYSAANQRLLSKTTTPVLWFHGLDEELLGQFELRSDNGDPAKQYPVLKDGTERIYAGGRLLMMGWQSVSTDRLGSVVRHGAATTQNRAKFNPYTRNPDYAWNRQYGTVAGRFTTPDPSEAWRAPIPQTFNAYMYTLGDPVNFNDPEGLEVNVPVRDSPVPTCLTRVFREVITPSGFGTTNDDNAATRFFSSLEGTFGLSLFIEVRPSGHTTDRSCPVYQAALGVGFVYINRYVVQWGAESGFHSLEKVVWMRTRPSGSAAQATPDR